MSGKMIDLIIQEPCRSCQGLWLKVEQPAYIIDRDGHMKDRPAEVRCVHEKVCSKLKEPVDDEKKLADKIADFLDTHPDKAISVMMHMVGDGWKHQVKIEPKKYGEWRK